jgi:methylmalonyl-CoA mutase N-terminal domain/subunit
VAEGNEPEPWRLSGAVTVAPENASQVDKETEQRQKDRLAEAKEERDEKEVEATLDTLDEAIQNGDNVVGPIIDSVKVYATMGEIMCIFEDRYGSYQETIGVA